MAKSPKELQNEPHALPSEIYRLSENGDGSVNWGHNTDWSLEEVLKPDYFRHAGRHGVQRLDKIDVRCEQHTPSVTFAELLVTISRKNVPIEVALLRDAQTIEISNLGWWEMLGVEPNATAQIIEDAYRDKAKKLHPDKKGGDKKRMQDLNKAVEEGRAIAGAREAA